MEVGPGELVVLMCPEERADADVVAAIADVVSHRYVTLLDLVDLARTADGWIKVVDVDEDMDSSGLGTLEVDAAALISEDDLELVRDALLPGTPAVVNVYEHTRARRLRTSLIATGGELALHVRIPPDTVDAAVAAAT